MTKLSPKVAIIALCVCSLFAAALFFGYRRTHEGLRVDSPDYQQFVDAFYSGVVALDVGDESHKDMLLRRASEIAPQEPAVWADLGLYYIRNSKLDEAQVCIGKASSLAPENAQIDMLRGLLAQRQGNYDQAVRAFGDAVSKSPNSLPDRYALLGAYEQAGTNNQSNVLDSAKALASQAPNNLFVRLKLAQLQAQQGDLPSVRSFLTYANALSGNWSAEPKSGLVDVSKTLVSGPGREASTALLGLANELINEPRYRADRSAVETSAERPGVPLDRPLVVPVPPSQPAPADMSTSFSNVQALTQGTSVRLVRQVVLVPQVTIEVSEKFQPVSLPARKESPASTVTITKATVTVKTPGRSPISLAYPGDPSDSILSQSCIAFADLNYDFLPDMAVVGTHGLKLYQQTRGGGFDDVTASSHLPAEVLTTPYAGIWPADTDSDGDLDLIVAPIRGQPFVLRNNGDGTWTRIDPFKNGPDNVVQCVWADLNGDGAPDVTFLSRDGTVTTYQNMRAGQYSKTVALPITNAIAITAADYSHSGTNTLTVLNSLGSASAYSWGSGTVPQWDPTVLDTAGCTGAAGTINAFWCDFDNNGGLDLVESGVSTSRVLLAQSSGAFSPLTAPVPANSLSVVSGTSRERQDMVGIDRSGQALLCLNHGDMHYNWEVVHPRANYQERATGGAPAAGQRINPFGYGGEIEVRSGLLYNKININDTSVRVGLGTYKSCNYIRILWPNGDSQSQGEFDIPTNQIYVAIQRLKASCPWLFAWNGSSMQLVTDCIWRSPLGLKINAQDTAGVVQTQDWLKIRGDQLVPHDGIYDLRICAELWETHFFDHLSLMTVDHPSRTKIYVDERFSIPPPPLKIVPTTAVVPVARATDENGTDVTDLVAKRDGRYVGTFGHGKYQGITKDHYLQLDLGNNVPKSGPLWLVATGWIHPTDSSINVAIGQGHTVVPKGLSIEVPDRNGVWSVARSGLGFPEGKIKTVLIDISSIFKPGAPKRLRLCTNLEIYWDRVGYATGLPATPLRIHRLQATTANLHFRGFSATSQADDSSPEIPDYNNIVSIGQRWRDLKGRYTRYGDVTSLLKKIDDRYVIMNAGDELSLQFKQQPPPPPGWVRDYVLIGDGWVKDGDYNTDFSRTVQPLPEHSLTSYNTPPNGLLHDPVYLKHKSDWAEYHTRFVDTTQFERGLLPLPKP